MQNTNYVTVDPTDKVVTFEDIYSFYTSFLGINSNFKPYLFLSCSKLSKLKTIISIV